LAKALRIIELSPPFLLKLFLNGGYAEKDQNRSLL